MAARDARNGSWANPSAYRERLCARYSSVVSFICASSSARSRASRLVNPKKSSARRKKPRVAFLLQLSRKAFPSRRWAARVSSRGTSALPIAGRRAAVAMPSSSVDFPEPFSPTKKVTGRSKASASSVRMAGTVKGNVSSAPARRLSAARWIGLTAPTYLLREVFHRTYKRPMSADQTCCCSSVYVQQRWVWDLPVRALVKEASMPETHPVANPRPTGAPPYEPVVRLGTPAMPGGASHPNHPVLLPDPDADDD